LLPERFRLLPLASLFSEESETPNRIGEIEWRCTGLLPVDAERFLIAGPRFFYGTLLKQNISHVPDRMSESRVSSKVPVNRRRLLIALQCRSTVLQIALDLPGSGQRLAMLA
jgi:hypothetical protein